VSCWFCEVRTIRIHDSLSTQIHDCASAGNIGCGLHTRIMGMASLVVLCLEPKPAVEIDGILV